MILRKKSSELAHMLIMTNKNNWQRQNHTKTDAGLRIVTLDDDTIQILKAWKERNLNLEK